MAQTSLFYETLGCFAALLSASAWAFSSILFRKLGDRISPSSINLVKCVIGSIYLGISFLLIDLEPVSSHVFILLGISGLLGIAIGDTLFFKALLYLGPKLTLLLGALGPVFTIIIAVIFLKERFSILELAGVFFILTGISLVLWKGPSKREFKERWFLGIIYAVLSTLCISLAIIFAKISMSSISTLQATFIRIMCGGIGLAIWGLYRHRLKKWLLPFSDIHLLKLILFVVFVAIFGGFWLFLFALKYTDASIATILNSTTSLFILPMAAFILKERISILEILGASVAVCGIALIFIR